MLLARILIEKKILFGEKIAFVKHLSMTLIIPYLHSILYFLHMHNC